jgi:hypothetical protein
MVTLPATPNFFPSVSDPDYCAIELQLFSVATLILPKDCNAAGKFTAKTC